MSSFWLGFIVGAIASPLALAAASKPLMRWVIKRKANQIAMNVAGKMGAFQQDLNLNKKEGGKNVKIEKKEKED